MIMNRANGARIDGSEHRAPESPERVQRGVSFCDARSILVIDAVVNTGLAAEVGMETRESLQYPNRASAYRLARDFSIIALRRIGCLRSTERGMLNHFTCSYT
jgi:hypothetical protein